jgi:hypothetical protein
MTQKKISQLPALDVVSNTDLCEVSKDLGGGMYTSSKCTMTQLGSYVLAGEAATAVTSSYATTTSFALAFTPNSIKVISTSYSIVSGDYTIICNPTASITITLPDASLVNGQTFNIKKFDSSSTITITGSVTGQLIDNMGSQQITIQYTNIQIQSAGANDYYIL